MHINSLFRFCGQNTFINLKHSAGDLSAKNGGKKKPASWRPHFKTCGSVRDKPKAQRCINKMKRFGHAISRYFLRVCGRQKTMTTPTTPRSQADNGTLSRTTHMLIALQERHLCAAVSAFLALERDPTPLLEKVSLCKQRLHVTDNRMLTTRELQQARAFKLMLINELKHEFVSLGFSERDATRQAKQAFASGLRDVLSSQKWETVHTHFHHNGVRYDCKLVPAAQMKQSSQPLFELPHAGGGVPSCATKDVAHATNLWASALYGQDKQGSSALLFKGVRHGILSPYGLNAHSDDRFEGAKNRALEVATAALFARPDLVREAEQGKTVSLKLTSTSLVTGGHGGEKTLLNDQMLAWKCLADAPVLHLPLRNAAGEHYHAEVNLEVAAFNFGVNELALKANLGWRQADGFNQEALNTLLGDDLRETAVLQGWAGRYLSDHPGAENAHRVRVLCQQLKRMWAEKSYHRDGGEPYKAALRVSLLAYEIGAVPCWNCKSGKDRTGMLDAELKREVIKIHQQKLALMPQYQMISTPGAPLDKEEQQLFQTILRHGGNREVQQYNTGAFGNKVIRMLSWPIGLSLRSRIGDEQVFKDTKGLSGLV